MKRPTPAALAAFRAARDRLASGADRGAYSLHPGQDREVLTTPAARAAIFEAAPRIMCGAPRPVVDYPARPDIAPRASDWRDAWTFAGHEGASLVLVHAVPPVHDNPDELDRELVLLVSCGPCRVTVRMPALT